MNWSSVVLITVLVAATVAPSALASDGIRIWWVTEPVMDPDPVESGEWADVTFQVGVLNRADFRGCREVLVTGMYDFPVCAYLLQWTISLDGEWLTDDSTPLGTGFTPYVRSLQEEGTITVVEVRERVHVNAEPGQHTLQVQVNSVAGAPISNWNGYLPSNHPYPCGLDERVDVPVVECRYAAEGWESAPPAEVEVLPATVQPTSGTLVPGLTT